MTGLRGCPFCDDGYPEMRWSDYPPGVTQDYWVECSECGAKGPYAHDEKTAVENWNRRVIE